MTESVTTVNKDVIDGAKVVSREMARIYTPLSKYEGGLSPTYGVDKCVLDDARVVYQCVEPEAPECEYWNTNGVSVRSHLRAHRVNVRKQEQADLAAQLAELQQREAQRRENYRNGALRAAATRKANRDNGNGEDTEMTDRQRKIDNINTSLEGVADGIDKITTVQRNMIKTLDNVLQSIAELPAEQVIDPVLVEKAASWDAMQALLNPSNKR